MVITLVEMFLVAFFLNLLYEMVHSLLYRTCLEMKVREYVPLIIRASFYDGLWVVSIYLLTFLLFDNKNIFNNYFQIISFFFISIVFAFFWELYSIKNKKWEYSPKMPLILRAGLTPTAQIFLTGFITLYIVFAFLP